MKKQAPAYTFVVETSFGRFVFAVLSLRQEVRIRPKANAIYGAPIPLPDDADAQAVEPRIAWALAEMEIAAVETPDGWDWEQLDDMAQLAELREAYVTARAAFQTPVATNS